MASKVEEICIKQINPIIESLGYEVIEVEYAKKVDGMNLSFYISKPEGILMEDCEIVAKAIEEPLDEVNPTNDQTYNLNVCSPGIDRPIKNIADFNRNKNAMVEVSLYTNLNGKKKYTGSLVEYDESKIKLVLDDETSIEIEHSKIGKISPVIEF